MSTPNQSYSEWIAKALAPRERYSNMTKWLSINMLELVEPLLSDNIYSVTDAPVDGNNLRFYSSDFRHVCIDLPPDEGVGPISFERFKRGALTKCAVSMAEKLNEIAKGQKILVSLPLSSVSAAECLVAIGQRLVLRTTRRFNVENGGELTRFSCALGIPLGTA
jgi:hypothetical protein